MKQIRGPGWPSERGWLAVGLYGLTAWVLWLCRPLAQAEPSEFFKTIATGVVITGFLNGVLGFYYASSKSNAEIRDQAAKALDIAHAATRSADRP